MPPPGSQPTTIRPSILPERPHPPGPRHRTPHASDQEPAITLTRHSAAAALVTTGVLHVVLWFTDYMDVAITGPAFLAQGVAAMVIAGLLYASDRDVLAPLASVALMTASVVALAAAYLGVFINTAERVIRPETGLSFGAGIVALVASALLVKQRADLRQSTDLSTPDIDDATIHDHARDDELESV